MNKAFFNQVKYLLVQNILMAPFDALFIRFIVSEVSDLGVCNK